MKTKILKFIFPVIGCLFLGGMVFWGYNYYEGGIDYYIKVNTDPTDKKDSLDDKGQIQGSEFFYTMNGFDKEGNKKEIDFTVHKERPLRKDAYIKLRVNKHRGPLNWEEVSKKKIPKKVQVKLDNT